jgi:uncharacterized protein (TIGR03067 family)
MKIILLCLAVAACITVSAAEKSEDSKAMQGTWKPVKAELGGQPWSETFLKITTLTLDNAGNYVVTVGDSPPDKGTCALDSSSKPKGLTITGVTGPNQGKTFPAIYALRGDTLQICYDLSGAKRPAEFKSIAGTQLFLVTYRREKK